MIDPQEAQEVFLSLCLADQSQIILWMPHLDADDFDFRNGLVWEAMCNLVRRAEPIKPDVTELVVYLGARKRGSRSELEIAGNKERLEALKQKMYAEGVLETPKAALFAEQLIAHRERKLFSEIAGDLRSLADSEGVDPDEAWAELFIRVSEKRRGARGATFRKLSDAYPDLKTKIDLWLSGKPAGRVPTGIPLLDKHLGGGLGRRHLTILGGLPGSYKTALVEQISESIAEGKSHAEVPPLSVAWFSIEMSTEDLLLRILCRKACVNIKELTAGLLVGSPKRVDIDIAAQSLSNLPFLIDDSASPTTGQIYSRAFSLALEAEAGGIPLGLIAVDFAELVGDETERGGGETERVSRIARRLKAVVKTLDVPGLLIAQLTKEVLRSADKRPQLHHLKYAGHDIADNVLFTWDTWKMAQQFGDAFVDKLPKEIVTSENRIYIDIAKARYAETGLVPLAIDRRYSKISDPSIIRVGAQNSVGFA